MFLFIGFICLGISKEPLNRTLTTSLDKMTCLKEMMCKLKTKMMSYKFKIENEMHEWDNQFISGAEVRAIPPGIPASMDLFVKRQGKPGELVENDQLIDLEEKGLEKFYSQVANSTPGI